MRNAIVTITIGDKYKEIASRTHTSMKQYANKIEADFIVITEQRINKTTPHWEKFQLYDILGIYDRVIFLDTDIIVREYCPNIFNIVPYDSIGAMNEHKYSGNIGNYYNTGVIVLSSCHKNVFINPRIPGFLLPGRSWIDPGEQDCLNIEFSKVKMFDLDAAYNMLYCVNTTESIKKAYVVHYAGFDKDLLNLSL